MRTDRIKHVLSIVNIEWRKDDITERFGEFDEQEQYDLSMLGAYKDPFTNFKLAFKFNCEGKCVHIDWTSRKTTLKLV